MVARILEAFARHDADDLFDRARYRHATAAYGATMRRDVSRGKLKRHARLINTIEWTAAFRNGEPTTTPGGHAARRREGRVTTMADRWAAAKRKLEQAAKGAGLEAQIIGTYDYDCSVRFRRGGREWRPPTLLDISIFEDEPSPSLDAVIEQAQKHLP